MRRNTKPMSYKPTRQVGVNWDKFNKGLNQLLNPTKIADNELSEAYNVTYIDEGSPVRRMGSAVLGTDTGAGGVYGLFTFYKSTGSNELLQLRGGLMYRYNVSGSTWALITGGSFSSGIYTSGVQTGDVLYLSNGTDNLTKYSGTTLTQYTGIEAPASNWITSAGSLVSGQYIYSYRVSAVNSVGETLACAAATVPVSIERDNWNPNPASLVDGRALLINWNTVTGAAGYNIYGYIYGNESYLKHLDGEATNQWRDYGVDQPSNVFSLPAGNTTTAPKGKYIIEFKSALLIGGDPSNPSRVYYSAGVDKPDSFLISDGGGWIDISKNSDDGSVSGMANYQNKAILFKERSTWQADFTESVLVSLQAIHKNLGCISHNTIRQVENDLFFVGRKAGGGAALYVLGNEANFNNVLRTNELSAKVRPILETLPYSGYTRANATYFDGKYHLFFQSGSDDHSNAAIVYDRERLGFSEWAGVNANLSTLFYDSSGNEYFIFADGHDERVSYLSENLTTDKGAAILWYYRTKELDFSDPFGDKKFLWMRIRMRNGKGTIMFKIYKNVNTVAYAINENVSSLDLNTSFGSLQFADTQFAETESGGASAQDDVFIKRIHLNRLGDTARARSISLEVRGETTESKAALLDVAITAKAKSKNYFDRSELIVI